MLRRRREPLSRSRAGIVLILVSALLVLLIFSALAFLSGMRIVRTVGSAWVEGARALLLARSGLEYARARLLRDPLARPHPASPSDDWTYRDDPSVPLEAAHNPSYGTCHPRGGGERYTPDATSDNGRYDDGTDWFAPGTQDRDGDGVHGGWTGRLRGTAIPHGDIFALRIEDANARIHLNGGRLDTAVSPEGIPFHRDATPGGPNGWLVRTLNHLDTLVAGTSPGTLGDLLVSFRPAGGYRSLASVRAVVGDARYASFAQYLTLHAWVDPDVARPQPMDARPNRFLDIDDRHRSGAGVPSSIAGLPAVGGIAGDGTESTPWSQSVRFSSWMEPSRDIPLSWERDFVYSWRQLRLGPTDLLEPRAPVSINGAADVVLASTFLGLQGVTLDTWEGTGGWDGGFSWYWQSSPSGPRPDSVYPYPDLSTDQTPWHRSRADYGSGYGVSGRPWYGPANYDPLVEGRFPGKAGRSLVRLEPLGRLRRTAPLTEAQARAVAGEIARRRREAGPFRTWAEVDSFVAALPAWEDLDGDGALDGAPYTVTSYQVPAWSRRTYRREDWNSDGATNRQVFRPASGSWGGGNISWTDLGTAVLPAGDVPGLTGYQKDVLRAMANPNTDLNDFNPDANLWKEVDKTDLAGIRHDPSDYTGGADWCHTTELSLDPAGTFVVESLGTVRGIGDRLFARRRLSGTSRAFRLHRDTTQADFMRGYASGAALTDLFATPAAPFPGAAGGQGLVSHPEPQTAAGAPAADAAYDGQIGLGFHEPDPLPDDRLRGSLFDAIDASATADAAVPDVHGPYRERLVGTGAPGTSVGSVFPDGAYSERDAALKYPMQDNFTETWAWCTRDLEALPKQDVYVFYVSFWVKPNWFPEACPRPHALLSLSPGGYGSGAMEPAGRVGVVGIPLHDMPNMVPLGDVATHPVGLYFVPARNNLSQGAMPIYAHVWGTSRGRVWPCRSLLWGATHSVYATDSLHRRGIETPPATRPVGMFEAHRWHHVAVVTRASYACITASDPENGTVTDNITPASALVLSGRTGNGGGWNHGMGLVTNAIVMQHSDGTPNHMRLGEIAAANNMNYVADATFANVQTGGRVVTVWENGAAVADSWRPLYDGYLAQFSTAMGSGTPATTGRYFKQTGAAYTSARLPAGARPLRVTWTEVPADLWFDGDADGWPGDAASSYRPRNDRFGPGGAGGADGLRDVRVDLEIWDDRGTAGTGDDVRLATFRRASDPNLVPVAVGRVYYKAVFANDWDAATRLNQPLDVTPYLDDVTVSYADGPGVEYLTWEEE